MNRMRLIQLRGFSPGCLTAALWCFLSFASAMPAAIAQEESGRPNANGNDDEAPVNVSVPTWDRLTVKLDAEASRSVDGKIEIEALDGSLLFQDMLGHLLLLKSHEVLEREQHKEPVELTAAALESRLKEELPDGFRLHQTRHYTFCYWTDREYTQWVATLYERLFAGFNNYWKNRGFDPQPAKRPLIVLVFANRAQFERFARTDMKSEPTGIIGYYHVLNNWVVMYDLMADGQFGNRDRGLSQALSHPNAMPMVATIVHEATHQLMYNNGMQQRLADIPLWVSEGLAVYFEAPDITSKQGWKGIGKINVLRYQRAKQYLRQRPADSLATLIQDDKRFRDGTMTLDAYAEAWALNYFLLKKYAKPYQAYLQELSKKTPLVPQTGEERIALFEEKLGKSLNDIDREFVQFLQKLQ
ncbi:MAG: DUF1570 domain-containing protein [Pirellulaceae bacterium]|nr:DUF1570 domain-containing protein [Pirellulaceae bacterium]